MIINMVGAFIRNNPFGTEIAFKKGFEQIPGCIVNTVDPSRLDQNFIEDADFSIVFKSLPKYREEFSRIKGLKIVYQPDDSRFPHIQFMMKDMLNFCTHALTFDNDGANIALSLGYKKSKTLLLTADPDLYKFIPNTEKSIDFCFIGSMSSNVHHKSRIEMVKLLKNAGFSVRVEKDLFDIEKVVKLYNSSKIVLNHATDIGQSFGEGFGYQCRHFEAGFSKACLLSNNVLNEKRLFNFASFKDKYSLLNQARFLLQNSEEREQMAIDFYEEIIDNHLPVHRAKEILEFVGA
jgi:spore maturation protein CgeB